jgi:hypothetical protein
MLTFSIIETNTKFIYGAPKENRTPTPIQKSDFESDASTSSAIGAIIIKY